MRQLKISGFGLLVVGLFIFFPEVGLASVESSLSAIQSKLVGTILPLAAVLGICWAGMSFVAGHPSAKAHLMLAIVGAAVGFGSQSIIALIRSVIH